jgi:hypothetical protein
MTGTPTANKCGKCPASWTIQYLTDTNRVHMFAVFVKREWGEKLKIKNVKLKIVSV